MEHVGELDIVDVGRRPGNEANVFAPFDRHTHVTLSGLTDGFHLYRRLLRFSLQFRGRLQDCIDYRLIAGAAADVALNGVANLFPRRHRIVFQKSRCRHQKTGCAEAALKRVPILEGSL